MAENTVNMIKIITFLDYVSLIEKSINEDFDSNVRDWLKSHKIKLEIVKSDTVFAILSSVNGEDLSSFVLKYL